jgi:PhzF family phenazine biosynthesis protein
VNICYFYFMTTVPIYQADAFTSSLFGGNPAAICPLHEWLPASQMQKIAAENNLAETAFFVPQGKDYELRWFTPTFEIDLCGHATLASAHILFTELGYPHDEIHFHTRKAGTLTVSRSGDRYVLNFPSRVAGPAEAPQQLIEALGGKQPVEVLRSRDYLLVYANGEDIAAMQPDFALLSKVDTIGVIVTAPGRETDFVSRFFAPAAGIPEDPVTGSAHCSLVPYWARRLGKDTLHAWQISARKGELWCTSAADRVLMAGKAVTYLRGTISV